MILMKLCAAWKYEIAFKLCSERSGGMIDANLDRNGFTF